MRFEVFYDLEVRYSFAFSRDSAPGRANEAVFFVLTNIDHDVISNEAVPLSPDAYAGATLGELGCWFDSSVTRMVQTGVEHCRVPDVSTYLGLGMPHISQNFTGAHKDRCSTKVVVVPYYL